MLGLRTSSVVEIPPCLLPIRSRFSRQSDRKRDGRAVIERPNDDERRVTLVEIGFLSLVVASSRESPSRVWQVTDKKHPMCTRGVDVSLHKPEGWLALND